MKITITRNNKALSKYNKRGTLKNFQFGMYTFQDGVLTTPKGNKYDMNIEDYLCTFHPFSQKYITVSIQEKTWNDYLSIWNNEELEFEGSLWQDINPIIVKVQELDSRVGKEDSDYSIQLQKEVETMKEELLQKYN